MIVQDALGHPRGSGAVDDVEVVHRRNLHTGRLLRGCPRPRVVGAEGAGFEIEADQATGQDLRQLLRKGGYLSAIGARHDQHLGLGVLQHQVQRLGGSHGGQGHGAAARHQRSEEGLLVLDAVARQRGDPVALPDAQPDQRVGYLLDPACVLPPANHAFAMDHGGLRCIPLRAERDDRGDVLALGDLGRGGFQSAHACCSSTASPLRQRPVHIVLSPGPGEIRQTPPYRTHETSAALAYSLVSDHNRGEGEHERLDTHSGDTGLLISTAVAGEVRDFGPDGTRGLTAEQERDLADGKVVFSTTDTKGKGKSALVEAAVVFDKPPEYVWELLYRTEDQVKFLQEVDELKIVEKEELQDNLELKLRIVFMTIVYRVIHHFEKDDLYIYWGLDPSFENDLLDVRGFWKLHPYGEGKTLARYGSGFSIKNVPQWVESLFKGRGVEKSLIAVRKYVNSGGTYRK